MITLALSLRFIDGQTVTAQISAKTETEDAPVSYSGPIDRLPFTLEKANAIELRAYFRSFARELHAGLGEQDQDDRAVDAGGLDETLEHLLKLGRKRENSGHTPQQKVTSIPKETTTIRGRP